VYRQIYKNDEMARQINLSPIYWIKKKKIEITQRQSRKIN